MSNELEVMLPLDTSHIRLPPLEGRVDDEDLYLEYIEVREGAGVVPYTEQGECATSVYFRQDVIIVVAPVDQKRRSGLCVMDTI